MRLTYTWYRNGTRILGVTGSTYTPGTASRGKAITVQVTGTRAGYASEKKTSKPTTRVR